MEGADSCIIVGTRKSLPKVYIGSESESDSGGLRHRYSSGSSSLGSSSSGSPNTPPSSTSTPYGKAALPQRFGVPGYINTGYGSFQPASYTDAYVPPLSLDRQKFGGYQNQFHHQNKSDEVIRIDSGYGRSRDDSYFMSRRNLSFNTSSSPSLWDSLVSSPIQNIRQKMRGRPSYVDEGSTASSRIKVKPQQILAGLIFALVLVSIVMILIISYKHFNNRQDSDKNDNNKPDSDKYFNNKPDSEELIKFNLQEEVVTKRNDVKVEASSEEGMTESLLLKDDVTIEEVEKMREELKAKIVSQSQELNDPKVSLGEAEAEILSNVAVYVEELLSIEVSTEDFTVHKESKDDKMQERDERRETFVKKEEEMKEIDVTNQKVEEFIVKGTENIKSKKKSKNTNPLTKSVREYRKSKAKSRLPKADPVNVGDKEDDVLDYPDDPTFRGVQNIKRTKRDEDGEDQGIGEKFRKYKTNNGDQFRKYTNDNDGGFRKKGSDLRGRE